MIRVLLATLTLTTGLAMAQEADDPTAPAESVAVSDTTTAESVAVADTTTAESVTVPEAADIPALDAVVFVPRFGHFRIRFFPEDAPNHVATFLTLAGGGAYDSSAFHRVVPELLIQAGDPDSRDADAANDGQRPPSFRIPHEPNLRTHQAGTVAMAWQDGRPGTAGTQWYVSLGDFPSLDEHGTIIGEVVEGMEVVKGVSQVSTRRNRNPLHRVDIQEVRLVPEGTPIEPAEEDSSD